MSDAIPPVPPDSAPQASPTESSPVPVPPFAPQHLRCNDLRDPMGIDDLEPRLSWRVNDPRRGAVQSAYQILVSNSENQLSLDRGAVWDSGKVVSDQSIQVPYGGPKPRSRSRYFWKVRTWDAQGQPSPYSAAAWWEMGLLNPEEWAGCWIGAADPVPDHGGQPWAPPYMRKVFRAQRPVVSARIYATALGLYELRLNGRKIGNDLFTPGWTDYTQRLVYHTYDVTEMLNPGSADNVLGAILGEGWYSGYLIWETKKNLYGNLPRLNVQLILRYADGRSDTITTEPTWRMTRGAIFASDIYRGEACDARKEPHGWDRPGYDESKWIPVVEHPAPTVKIVAAPHQPIRHTQTLVPKAITEPAPGVFVFDMGTNMVGVPRLKIQGTAGLTITLRHAEVLKPDGHLYLDNLRSAKSIDTYVLSGLTEETYEPKFTYHGFRYLELTGLPAGQKPSLDTITGLVLHSDAPVTGEFECSSPMINQLQQNILRSQRGNFFDTPTDCPQRDERLGWTGDAQVFVRTATFNMDVAPFFNKWILDLQDEQLPNGGIPYIAPNPLKWTHSSPAWADAIVICPWTIYLAYGDTRILTRHFDAMVKFIDYMEKHSADLVRPKEGFGDWLDINDPTARDVIATAFFAYSTQLAANIGRIIKRKREAARFTALAKKIRSAFCDAFVTPGGRVMSDSQTAYVLALRFQLLPDKLRPLTAAHLARVIHERSDHLATGFVGTSHLMPTLSESGNLELAYKLLNNETFPSWGYTIKNGATSMWERWDGWTTDKGFQTPSMNSFNHYAFGAVGQWMYSTITGLDLDPEAPGYKHIILRPRPATAISKLTHAKATYDSAHGRIESQWFVEGDAIHYRFVIPANTYATVTLPGPSAETITESGQSLAQTVGVSAIHAESDVVTFKIGAGEYRFKGPIA